MVSLSSKVQQFPNTNTVWIVIRRQIASEFDLAAGDIIFQDIKTIDGEKIITISYNESKHKKLEESE